ncbi:heparinase II/III family protein [Lichenihabitans sp. Uapishka_5]|uniref:heparinase II/III family protein n=1 Tax=Lichenihabitans sp. Uapishka_5 TaxID=3037302 RepID=UPI0029E827A6|nr:heparinase II/III family protein [Lichenihabitans sp. Uapishka_5]MDX7951054.1 heparinase II/III family protein [Lichenihabitans sp. Uapishka_5]
MRRPLSETARLAAGVTRIEARRALTTAQRPFRLIGRLQSRTPERLVIAPQDIRTADPTVASDIYAGHLAFAGRLVDAHGRSPFDIEPPTEAWAAALHGFGWLRHLRAADTALARANARVLVDDWINHCTPGRVPIAWHPEVTARRLLSWLAQSPLVLDPPDAGFYRRYMKSIGRQVGVLARALSNGLDGAPRLFAAIALAEAGVCADGLGGARKAGTRILTEELRRQFLPDGGHVSRDPGILVACLLDLLPLRQAFAARGLPLPTPLMAVIDRAVPVLRMFRHGDGSLALFNGMGVTEAHLLATVLSHDDTQARPLGHAPHSGYRRLEAGPALVICDTGAPPAPPFSERAHAGTLAFEFSHATQRLIVNCGRPAPAATAMQEVARATAAHSTLVLDDASSSRFADGTLRRWFGRQITSGPRQVTAQPNPASESLGFEVRHDGYAERFGLIHRRKLTLAADGSGLFGEDGLEPAAGAKRASTDMPRPFMLRFHLHPGTRAEEQAHGKAVMLVLPDGTQWMFEAGGQDTRVEESIFFATSEGPRRTTQIVVPGLVPARSTVDWSLLRQFARDRDEAGRDPSGPV